MCWCLVLSRKHRAVNFVMALFEVLSIYYMFQRIVGEISASQNWATYSIYV